MAITDIQISEELETNAPSIKYRGNEGPRSPQEMQQMMAGSDRYFQVLEMMINELEGQLGRELTDEEYEAVGKKAYDFLGGMSDRGPILPSPEDPVNPFVPKPQGPVLPDRQMAAYGGMMGGDGRRRYGLGSFLKSTVRKVIPNEIADIAVKAAPFIAPFNPLAAGIAAGLGSFDQTGSISGGLKSGLKNYALGQFARGVGGGTGNLQTGFNPMGGMEGMKYGFSSPLQGEGGLSKLLNKTKAPTNTLSSSLVDEVALTGANPIDEVALTGGKNVIESQSKNILGNLPKLIKDNLNKVGLGNNLVTGLLVGGLGAGALMENMTEEEVLEVNRGEGLDVEAIRTEVLEAMKDPSGEALKAIRAKYPFLGRRETKDLSAMAMGGRIGKAEGGIMDLGGKEKDYRNTGGFVDLGAKEKADDVPARLSVNEFVFTADAVRNAGGGDVDQGAKVMERVMKHLEGGGQMSRESQGMGGAREMFEVSERLSEVV